jgi:multidrug efflux pump subunit AcrA (membrane-fusion protein)
MNRKKNDRFVQLGLMVFSMFLVIFLSACSTAAEETTTPRPRDVDNQPLVSATGKIVPEREALLSVSAGGVIEDVLVIKGDQVAKGQVLVQLEGTEQQSAAVSAAEMELTNAQFALDQLYKDTDLKAAESLRSAELAEQALEDLYNNEQQQALAEQAVAEAEKIADSAEKNLAYLTNPPSQDAIDQAYDNMLLAENKLNKTIEDINKVEKKIKKYSASKLPSEIRTTILKNLRKALKGLDIQKTQAQLAYNKAQHRYNNLLRPPDPVDLQVAEAAHLNAQAKLQQAARDLERVLDGPDTGDVAVLEAQIEKGYRDYETFSAGPDPDDVALAEARIANAEAQLAAAKSTLADLELVAPFDGVISAVYINSSEWVNPGSPVLLIADLENLQVETTDLSEIDVAQIVEGDIALITFDALPDLEIEGTVISIAPKAEEGAGVNYPVILELSEMPSAIRWGMTAFVDIENPGNK